MPIAYRIAGISMDFGKWPENLDLRSGVLRAPTQAVQSTLEMGDGPIKTCTCTHLLRDFETPCRSKKHGGEHANVAQTIIHNMMRHVAYCFAD